MARNRGKRPGAASGSSSPSQSQARDAQGKADGASAGSDRPTSSQADPKTPVAASQSIAAKIDPPAASSSKAGSAEKPSSVGTKSPSSTSSTGSKPPSSTSSTGSKPPVATTSAASHGQAARPAVTAAVSAGGGATAKGDGGGNGGASSDGGFWPGLIGGVIGGAATALAASLFWMSGDDQATTALESRLAEAELQVEQIGVLNDRVAAVETASPSVAEDSDLGQRLDDLETRLAELGAAPSGGGFLERVASLEQQIETLSALEQRVEVLAGDVEAVGETQAANVQALASLGNALPGLEESLATTGASVGQASEQTAALDQSVQTLNGNVLSLTERVGDAESRLDHLGGEYQRGAAMIVAIGDINRAVTKAEPFDNSLQTLKSLVRDDAALGDTLAKLEPVAADGVPTLGGLKDGFGQMASRVLLAEEGDPSLTDQVSNNVFGIFNMRPAGADVEGSGSRAVLARAQSELSTDDLEGAIGELDGLEGAAAEEAAGWIDEAGARLAAEAAVVDLRAHAQGLVAKGS